MILIALLQLLGSDLPALTLPGGPDLQNMPSFGTPAKAREIPEPLFDALAYTGQQAFKAARYCVDEGVKKYVQDEPDLEIVVARAVNECKQLILIDRGLTTMQFGGIDETTADSERIIRAHESFTLDEVKKSKN